MQSPDRAAAWEAEGRRLAPALDPVAAALVTGLDVDAAAHLALGIASAQMARRRVAVADLTGAARPIARLVPDDDPHGLADSFLYGVSLNMVARQVDADGRLFVLPTGSEPALEVGLADTTRWRRVADGFRDVGALLLLVAPSDAPGLAELAERVDGTIATDHGPATQRLPRLLATAETPDAALPRPVMPRPRAATPGTVPTAPSTATPILPGRRINPVLIAVVGLVVIAGLVWAARSIGRSESGERPLFGAPEARPDSAAGAMLAAPAVASIDDTLASALVDSLGDSTATGASTDDSTPPAVANPEELGQAAAWTIVFQSFPSEAAATRAYRARPRMLAAPTVALAPASGVGGESYRVLTGGWTRRAAAMSALASLQSRGIVPDTAGRLVRLPYAVQLASSVARDSVVSALNQFLGRGIPAYAMRQPSGRAHVYAGAFAEPSEARALLASLQAAGVPAALVVRTGSPL